jgi:putative membrane protein
VYEVKSTARGCPPACILKDEERNMIDPRTYGKKMAALAGAWMLCGTLGLAQAGPPSGGAGAPGQAPGQNPSMDSQMNNMQTNGQASPLDKMFVRNALQGGMAEVQLGQLTLQKSNNEQVKQFAQKMIDDHTKLGDQMKPIAQQVGVPVPTEISKKDKKTMAQLQGLSGTAYDQAYIKDMVKDHKKDLSDFQSEVASGQDPAVKDAANQGSQVITQHLQLAQQLAKDQNVNMASK